MDERAVDERPVVLGWCVMAKTEKERAYKRVSEKFTVRGKSDAITPPGFARAFFEANP